LRWILQQAAWTAIRTDENVKFLFARIARRAGRKAAAVAIARKLLTWMWGAVWNEQDYRSPGTRPLAEAVA
jgi:transposase